MPSRAHLPADADEVVELEHWDAADGSSEEDFDEELPAEAEALVETSDDLYGAAPEQLPQPDKGHSMPDLPKVKSSAFKRILK